MKYLPDILGAIKLVMGIFSLWAWYKIGFKCPRYIHILAVIGFLVGIGMTLITPKNAPANDTWGLGKWWTPVIFSGIVYFLFGFFGGAKVMGKTDDKENVDSAEE
jgi:predicted ferric reductase